MEIHHLRNASMILTLGEHRILVDPMLSNPGALGGFKFIGGDRRRNPLVPLPVEASAALDDVTDVLVTHEHPDHLDRPAIEWITTRGLPVWAATADLPNLRKKGLDARMLVNGALGMAVEPLPVRHGRGPIGWLMGPVSGFYLDHPAEPSVMLTSDAVMSRALGEAVDRLRPGVIVAPAGAANFGAGPDILFSLDELVALVRRAPGDVVFNHLEALDHCPTTRNVLRARMSTEGLTSRIHVPEDGEALLFHRRDGAPRAVPSGFAGNDPGFQKWLTSFFTGT